MGKEFENMIDDELIKIFTKNAKRPIKHLRKRNDGYYEIEGNTDNAKYQKRVDGLYRVFDRRDRIIYVQEYETMADGNYIEHTVTEKDKLKKIYKMGTTKDMMDQLQRDYPHLTRERVIDMFYNERFS